MSTPAQTPAVPRCQKCNGLVAVKALVTAGGDLNELFWECDDCEHHWFAPLPLVAELARQRDEHRGWLRATLGECLVESKRTQPFKKHEWHIDAVGSYFGIPPEVVRAILGTGQKEG